MNQGHTPAQGEAEVEAELTRLKTQAVSDDELKKPRTRPFAISS